MKNLHESNGYFFLGGEGFLGGGKFSQVFVGGERFLKFRDCVKEKRLI